MKTGGVTVLLGAGVVPRRFPISAGAGWRIAPVAGSMKTVTPAAGGGVLTDLLSAGLAGADLVRLRNLRRGWLNLGTLWLRYRST